MIEPRSYVLGLPVVITVEPDGRVSYEIDLSEAMSDLDENLEPGTYTEEQIAFDRAAVEDDVDRRNAEATRACPRCAHPRDQHGLLGCFHGDCACILAQSGIDYHLSKGARS